MTTQTPQGGFVDPDAQTDSALTSADAPKVVLLPAKVPTWRASSHDLLTGADVSEVEDTIPGDLLDELFKDTKR